MEQIQQKAIKTYLENLQYLQKNNLPLYNKIDILSKSIENENYQERYSLEYIQKDAQFDIFDALTNTYLYKREPNQFIKESVKNSNFDKLNSIDLLFPTIYNTQQEYYIDPTENTLTRSTKMYHNDIFEFIKIFQKSTVYKQKKFKYIEKFIFVGALLGTHIEPIVKKLNLDFYLIYEHNLEIFRLSLFTTNYAQLSQKSRILFSIDEDKTTTEWTLSQFFNHAIRSNYMLKYYCSNYNIHDYFDRILSVSSQRSPFAFSYTKMFDGFLKPNFLNIVKYPVLQTKKHYDLFQNKPVLIVAAGPSFGHNIEWLQQNHQKYFVVAIGAVIKKLCDQNILPDMITNADGDEIIKKQFPDEIREKITHIPFLTSTATHTSILEMFDTKNIILVEVMGAFKNISTTINGYSVGEVTLGMLTKLGANEIYMLGTDLALDQETGATHIQEHGHSVAHDISDEKKELNSFMKTGKYNTASTTLTIKGNFRESVITTATMEKSVYAYNKNIITAQSEDPSLKIYNLSDGAFIQGTTPLKVENIKIPSGSNTLSREDIINFAQQNSEIGFNSEEQKVLLESLKVLDTLKKEIEKLTTQKFKTYDQFIAARGTIMTIINNDLKVYATFYIDRLLLTYFLTMEPYLGFQFNEKLSNEQNYLKKVKKVWCTQMIRIIDEYSELVKSVTQ